jgi:hypothetical protein
MEILKFKTNITSEDNLQKIMPILNNEQSIHEWQIDSSNPDNLLTLSGTEVDPQLVINLLQKAGFEVEFMHVFGAAGGGL